MEERVTRHSRSFAHSPLLTSSPSLVSSPLRTWLTRIGSLLLGGVLLYLALRGVDFGEVVDALRTANWAWGLPIAGVLLLSHWLRSWRWAMLLEEIPSDSEAPPLRVRTAFASLMIGYMVNYATPRLGEIVRSANLSRQSRRPLAAVMGTVVIERVLDVVVLALALGSVVVILWEQLGAVDELVFRPLRERAAAVPLWVWGSVLAVSVALGVLWIWRRRLRQAKAAQQESGRFVQLWMGFRGGVTSLFRTRRPLGIALTTVGIWTCYLFAAYWPLVMLRMAGAYGLSPIDGWCVMLLGAIGQLVPSPGGVGSYHFVTIQSMVTLFGVPQAPAATYAVLMHAAQLVLYSLVGFLALLAQGTSLRTLQGGAQEKST